jgi:predicted TIM-barrel fold metal-dependent hydrolase
MDSYLKFIKEIDLSDEKKELIMWKNAAELFKIELF